MIKARGVEYSYTVSCKDRSRQFYVTLWEQPLHLWWAAKLVHALDVLLYKMPGFTRLERWHQTRYGRGNDFFIPLGCRLDIMCFDAYRRGRVEWVRMEISEFTYRMLTKRRY